MSSYANLKAKQTEAVAPRSLFGTDAEIKVKGAYDAARDINTPSDPVTPDKFARYRRSDANKVITNAEDQYKCQKNRANEAHEELLEVESKALNFHPDSRTVVLGINCKSGQKKGSPAMDKANKVSSHQMTSNVLQNEITRLASDLHQDFPCPHFSKEAPSNDTYQMLGNALGKGGKISYRGKEYATVGPKSMRPKTDLTKLTSRNSVRSSPRPPSVPIPANIRHKYGDSVCSSVLEDAQLLDGEDAISHAGIESPPKSGTPTSITGRTSSRKSETAAATDTLYDGLSNALRQDIFNGVSHSHLKSLSASSYTAYGNKKATQSYPPKFAVMRNEDSKWNEDMVIYQKLMKEWDAVMAERAKPAEG